MQRHIVMALAFMAYIALASMVMAYTVMVYLAMAYSYGCMQRHLHHRRGFRATSCTGGPAVLSTFAAACPAHPTEHNCACVRVCVHARTRAHGRSAKVDIRQSMSIHMSTNVSIHLSTCPCMCLSRYLCEHLHAAIR